MKHNTIGILFLLSIFITNCGIKQYQKGIQFAYKRIESAREMKGKNGTIQFTVQGEGIPLIIAHGSGGGFDMGLAFGKVLGEGIKTIAVSRFGYLSSSVPDSPTVELQADIYAELLDSLGIEKAAILGNSGGGPSSLQFALRHPDKCSHLILVQAVTIPFKRPQKIPFLMRFMFKSDYRFWRATRRKKKLLKKFGTPSSVIASMTPLQNEWINGILATMHPSSRRLRGIEEDLRLFVAPNSYPVKDITSPALIIYAKDDPIVDSTHFEFVAKNIPNIKLLQFPKGGHLSIGNEIAMKEKIYDFLKDN